MKKVYRETNREKCRQAVKKCEEANKERYAQKRKIWYEANKERVSRIGKERHAHVVAIKYLHRLLEQ